MCMRYVYEVGVLGVCIGCVYWVCVLCVCMCMRYVYLVCVLGVCTRCVY